MHLLIPWLLCSLNIFWWCCVIQLWFERIGVLQTIYQMHWVNVCLAFTLFEHSNPCCFSPSIQIKGKAMQKIAYFQFCGVYPILCFLWINSSNTICDCCSTILKVYNNSEDEEKNHAPPQVCFILSWAIL